MPHDNNRSKITWRRLCVLVLQADLQLLCFANGLATNKSKAQLANQLLASINPRAAIDPVDERVADWLLVQFSTP